MRPYTGIIVIDTGRYDLEYPITVHASTWPAAFHRACELGIKYLRHGASKRKVEMVNIRLRRGAEERKERSEE